VARSNPFGNAKPVDTTGRLSEIEKKLEGTRIELTSTSNAEKEENLENREKPRSETMWARGKPRKESDNFEEACEVRSTASSNKSMETVARETTVTKQPSVEKPKFVAAPAPQQSAWGRKMVPSAHNSEGSRGEAEGSKSRERQPVEGEESRRVARQPAQVTKPYKAYQAPARRGDQGGYQATRNRGAYSQQGGNTRDDDRRRRDRRGDGSHDNGSFSRGYSNNKGNYPRGDFKGPRGGNFNNFSGNRRDGGDRKLGGRGKPQQPGREIPQMKKFEESEPQNFAVESKFALLADQDSGESPVSSGNASPEPRDAAVAAE